MAASQWTFATAVDTAKALANREISSVELTQLAIDRIALFKQAEPASRFRIIGSWLLQAS